MRRRSMLGFVWLVGTISAALLATFAVGFLGDRITNPAIKPLSRDQLVEELAAGEQATGSSADDRTSGASSTSVVDEPGSGADDREGSGPGDGRGNGVGPDDDKSSTPDGATNAPASAPITPTSVTPARPTTSTVDDRAGRAAQASPGGPTTTAPQPSSGPVPNASNGSGSSSGPGPATTAPPSTPVPVSRSFQTSGGTVQATCNGATITASATPAPGWSLDQSSKTSGSDIDIRFRQGSSGSTEVRVRADCAAGVPTQHQ